jgi:hypothetical protein
VSDRINIDEHGRPVQDVYGAFPATAPSVGAEQPSPAASSGEVRDGGPSPAAVEAPEPTQATEGERQQRAFDGGAPSDQH